MSIRKIIKPNTTDNDNDDTPTGVWNYRLMAHQIADRVEFEVHEVYYNKAGKPIGYCKIRLVGDTIKEIKKTLDYMKKCLKHPILWAGDNFPNEYKP